MLSLKQKVAIKTANRLKYSAYSCLLKVVSKTGARFYGVSSYNVKIARNLASERDILSLLDQK